MSDKAPQFVVAACSGCGRGYLSIGFDGIACMVCGSPVRFLPAPDVSTDCDAADRQRWKEALTKEGV